MRNIPINKEVFNYRETIFFGLTMRQFICAILAIGIAVGTYFLCNNRLGKELTSWLCIIGAAPPAFVGFFRCNGMTAEEFAIAWFKTNILYAGVRTYSSENYLLDILYSGGEDIEEEIEDEEEPEEAWEYETRRLFSPEATQLQNPPQLPAKHSNSKDL